MNDWFMSPLLAPGSVVLIDERQRKVARAGWTDISNRPIYFVEHRQGYVCGWASLDGERIVMQPHPASPCTPLIYSIESEAEVLGRVVAMATLLGSRSGWRPPGAATAPTAPDQ